jgi:hypothetical protein
VLELHTELLDRLGSGDDVFAAERLKETALALADGLAGLSSEGEGDTLEEQVRTILEPVDDHAEALLTVLLPTVEYGGPAAVDVLPRLLVHVARRTSLAGQQSSLPFLAATLVVGRLVWALAAYSLHCGRLGALTAAWRATLPSRYDEGVPTPLLGDSALRHPDVFTRHADKAYIDYREWLAGRQIIGERYPVFAEELEDVFAEADVWLALRSAAATQWDVYSHGLSSATVRRIRARSSDAREREELARFFAVPGAELARTLADAYARLRVDQRLWDRPPAHLFPEQP